MRWKGDINAISYNRNKWCIFLILARFWNQRKRQLGSYYLSGSDMCTGTCLTFTSDVFLPPPHTAGWRYRVRLLTLSSNCRSKVRIQLDARNNTRHHRDSNQEIPDQKSPTARHLIHQATPPHSLPVWIRGGQKSIFRLSGIRFVCSDYCK